MQNRNLTTEREKSTESELPTLSEDISKSATFLVRNLPKREKFPDVIKYISIKKNQREQRQS